MATPSLTTPFAQDLLAAVHEIARIQFARQGKGHTLQPTALANEVWLRILQSEVAPPSNLNDFRVWASTVIKNILISHARTKNAEKRGGGRVKLQLQPFHGEEPEAEIDLLHLDEALLRLKEVDSVAARVVDLRFFGGMDHHQIGIELGFSERQSFRKWAMARSWLRAHLEGE